MKCSSKCTRKKKMQKPAMRRIKCHLTFLKLFLSFFQPAKRSIQFSRTGIINFVSVSEHFPQSAMSMRTQLRKAQLEISPLSGDTYSHNTHKSKLLSHEKNGNSFRFPAKRRSTNTNNALNSTIAFLAYLTLIPAQRRKNNVILISKRCRFFLLIVLIVIFLLIVYLFVIIENTRSRTAEEKLAYGMK